MEKVEYPKWKEFKNSTHWKPKAQELVLNISRARKKEGGAVSIKFA